MFKCSINRTILLMDHSLIAYLGSQPIMKLIRGLFVSRSPRHLRELAAEYSLSPSGVSDVLRRLGRLKVLTETRVGNRRCFSLNLSASEQACLKVFFSTYEQQLLEKRAIRLSQNAEKKLEWMDQAHEFYRAIKRR